MNVKKGRRGLKRTNVNLYNLTQFMDKKKIMDNCDELINCIQRSLLKFRIFRPFLREINLNFTRNFNNKVNVVTNNELFYNSPR